MSDQHVGVVILAAGASTRLGRAKQLIPFRGKTLIQWSVDAAIGAGAAEVIVVIGAGGDTVREVLAGSSVRLIDNPDWAEGMGSSIRYGVSALTEGIECVVVALCDQPMMTSAHLRALADRHFETGAPIVASTYDGVKGAPSAFGATVFPSLRRLQGDAGARDLIRHATVPVEVVPFLGGHLDVDVEEDVRRLGG